MAEFKLKMELLEGAKAPSYVTKGSAGMDLFAYFTDVDYVSLEPLERKIIPTGIKIQLPEGYLADVRSKSGISSREGKVVILGLIDCDYRGQVGVILANISNDSFTVCKGDPIAQIVFTKYERAEIEIVPKLDENTERGSVGFGGMDKIKKI